MKISSIQDLEKISNNIKKKLILGDVVFLYGEIGVGKTTFARMLINNYEKEKNLKESEVLSPTFNIVFEYDIKEFIIKHFDLYRLKDPEEIFELGWEDFGGNDIALIEWPSRLEHLKPGEVISICIEIKGDVRHIHVAP